LPPEGDWREAVGDAHFCVARARAAQGAEDEEVREALALAREIYADVGANDELRELDAWVRDRTSPPQRTTP